MRRRGSLSSFRNFIVLADIVFAVTAGFMLLHPIDLSDAAPEPPPRPAPPLPPRDLLDRHLQDMITKLQAGIGELDRLTQDTK